MKLATRLAVAFALVLVVIVSLGTTAVSASNALPGDLLYPLKTSAQNAQLMLTWNTETRQALEYHFQEEYRQDVRVLMQDGRQVQVRFVGTLDAIDTNIWVVGGLPVLVDQGTTLPGNPQLGDVVQVEAAVQKDGSILASRLVLNGAPDHHLEVVPQMTPEHTPIHTAEPEHHQNDLEHTSPTAALQPKQTLEHHDDPTRAPSATAAPVHHDDGSTCQTCGSSSGGTSGGHDSGHDDGHDGGHDGGHE